MELMLIPLIAYAMRCFSVSRSTNNAAYRFPKSALRTPARSPCQLAIRCSSPLSSNLSAYCGVPQRGAHRFWALIKDVATAGIA